MVQKLRMAGSLERRPNATSSAMGKHSTSDSEASRMVSGRPPQRSVSTWVKPMTLPYIKTKNTASTPSQSSGSQGFQKTRTQLATNRLVSSNVAISGRHCSSKG